MIHTMARHLEHLHELARANNQRIRLHRAEPTQTRDAVFRLELTDHTGALLIEVSTRNIESAALYMLNHYNRHT